MRATSAAVPFVLLLALWIATPPEAAGLCAGRGGGATGQGQGQGQVGLTDPREVRFADLVQLTDGGENAEAYWSPDGTELVYVLRQAKPGQTVKAVVGRDGQRLELQVTFGESQRPRG